MATSTKKNLVLLDAGFRSTWSKNGREMDLRSPEGAPSDAQLAILNKRGCLAIVQPGQVEPISKGTASAALDVISNGNGS